MSIAPPKSGRIDIGSIRREQIAEAACAIIAEQGIQNLSLSEIESKVGMSRGQLTYYFKTKEEILLAVFDRFLRFICQQQGENDTLQPHWPELVRDVLGKILQRPPLHPEFLALQYTFLSQLSHRADFRQRLASLYEDWRGQMTQALAQGGAVDASLRNLATLVQAIFHGLAIQFAADPKAVNAEEITNLCLDVLGVYLRNQRRPRVKSRIKQAAANGAARRTNHGRNPH